MHDRLGTLLRKENNITGSASPLGLFAIPYGKKHIAFFDNIFPGIQEGSLIVTRPIEL